MNHTNDMRNYFFEGKMLLDTFGARVRYLRRLWGLRQTDIYKAGGPSRSTLSRIESGDDGPGDVSESTLQGLALSLRCTREWLETGTGKVWLDGVVPPEGVADESVLQTAANSARAVHVVPRPDPELSKFTSVGYMDWRVLERAVDIVRNAYQLAGGASEGHDVHFAEAYRLVYLYISKQKDPFDPVHETAAGVLLTVAWD